MPLAILNFINEGHFCLATPNLSLSANWHFEVINNLNICIPIGMCIVYICIYDIYVFL